MILQNNVVINLSGGFYQIFVKGTASIYFKNEEISDFVLDSTLTNSTNSFVLKNSTQLKAIIDVGSEVSIV